ncbi:helix-turn-helix transcriptional regulator [Streptomyces antimicrobicus]|uniref:Winged helix-turn-helix domain-containing protein n=1 Tax=Streptomyces antimicrobicus TaxID=2883108 RepID=A0ABS8B2C9_9ACTN|nr:helix-turn-helix domain-containing protein [Streptomyces antimicrobicus]MCB5178770.1 winged helix-turn-helix domain-containing protein [Streptomyces antimicrobicus]
MPPRDEGRPRWTFLTSHARVLVAISRDPGVRVRDVAAACGLTERTVLAIVADLEKDGYLLRDRAADGRRNRYAIVPGAHFRHPAEAGHEVAGLLDLLSGRPPAAPAGHAPEAGTDADPRPEPEPEPEPEPGTGTEAAFDPDA